MRSINLDARLRRLEAVVSADPTFEEWLGYLVALEGPLDDTNLDIIAAFEARSFSPEYLAKLEQLR
jgi:hypothetical protein